LGRIPDEIIQQIRDRVDIVDLVSRHVTLKQAGRSYKGLCPFHNEKTPSFNVNPDREAFYCFGCQEGGNALTFLMKVEGLTFPEAARALAAEVGIEIPETVSGESGISEKIFAANDVAQATYRSGLASPSNPAAAYLERRGLDAETIEHFGLGFVPDRWDTVVGALRQSQVPAEIGEKAGLLAARTSGGHYDRLRGRVTFPIRDVRGRVVGFGGRAIFEDQEPKYLNSPESPVYKKREAFYGFPMALEPIRRCERAVVVEGYFDLIALHRAGIEGVLASCGTALTEDHGRQLRRRTREVVLLFDGDEAGQKAVERSLSVLLPTGLRVRAAALPSGEDPDSFLEKEGAEKLQALVDRAPPALEIVIRRAVSQGVSSAWEKADAVAAVAPLLGLVSSPVERGELCVQLALAVGTEARHVEAAVRSAARGDDPREAVPAAPILQSGDERKLRRLAQSLIEHPQLASRVPTAELASLVPLLPLTELISALIDAAAEERSVDLEDLAERLDEEPRNLLRALAADTLELEEAAARETIDDTLAWLRRRHARSEQRALTQRLQTGGSDVATVIQEKQRKRTEPHGPGSIDRSPLH
jgi:DNA primase